MPRSGGPPPGAVPAAAAAAAAIAPPTSSPPEVSGQKWPWSLLAAAPAKVIVEEDGAPSLANVNSEDGDDEVNG